MNTASVKPHSLFLRVLLTAIFAAGTAMTVYLLVRFGIHSAYVAHPDAMLPVADYENAFVLMAVGFPFMLASSLSMVWAWGIRRGEHALRNTLLLLLPAIVDAVPFVMVLLFAVAAVNS